MPQTPLAANTDLIKSELLRKAEDLAGEVLSQFQNGVRTNTPLGVVRSDMDKQLIEFANGSTEFMSDVLEAVKTLCGGDISNIDAIRKMFERVEELNSGSPDRTRH